MGRVTPFPSATSAPRTARERVRIELTREIKAVARAQLATGGGAALSLRAVARELGMASSALFRYFPNRDALLTALIIDSYAALADAAEAAEAQVHEQPVLVRWMAICRAIREWALAQPHEYALIFGSPIPGYAAPRDTVGPATRVPVLLGTLLADLATQADGATAPADLAAAGDGAPAAGPAAPADLVAALQPVAATLPAGVPPDLLVRGLMGWTYLFGAISFELFGHRHGVISDHRTFFDHEMTRIAVLLGYATAP